MALLASVLVFLVVMVWGIRPRKAANLQSQLEHWFPREAPKPATGTLASRAEGALRASGLPLRWGHVIAGVTTISLLLTAVASRVLGSLPAGLLIGSLGLIFPYTRLKQFEIKQRELLSLQFKEALTAVAYSLKAGASLQMAVEQALLDLRRIFPAGDTAPIIQEFEELVRQLRLGVPLETVLTEWDARTGLEEISDFVAATLAVKMRGGNLAEVMTTVSETISWKIVAQAQIRALTAEKRSEATLLTAMPPLVLLALWFFSPSYIAPLFTTSGGQVILLIGIACNIMAYFAVRKVLESPL